MSIQNDPVGRATVDPSGPTGRVPFLKELEELINRHSKENGSDTPDFILAEYLWGCLRAFDFAVKSRGRWYGDGDDKSSTASPSETTV